MNRFINSFKFNNHIYYFYDLKRVFEDFPILKKLPNSLKTLLEINLRNAKQDNIDKILRTFINKNHFEQIEYYPNRVIMDDFKGIPILLDLAYARQSNKKKNISPRIMVDLIINKNSNITNIKEEIKKTKEINKFVKWASKQFDNFSVIPPNKENFIQINLEYLSTMINFKKIEDKIFIYPEAVVGTNKEASSINALGVIGLKVSEIKAQAFMLEASLYFDFPKVIGIEVKGSFAQGVNIDDLVLSLSTLLEKNQVRGKIVEFYSKGLKYLSIESRAILSDMATRNGALCGYFSIDDETICFVERTRGVDASLIKEYYLNQSIYFSNEILDYDEKLIFDLSTIKPTVLGSKKSEERFFLKELPFKLKSSKKGNFVKDNDIVLALIKSNQDTLSILNIIQTALLVKKAYEFGLTINSNINLILDISSLQKEYLQRLGLFTYLKKFSKEDKVINLVQKVEIDIEKFNLNLFSLSSNSINIEYRIHPLVKSNWSMSAPLIIAYCLKGNMNFDITSEAICADIYLSDIWPSITELNETLKKLDNTLYKKIYQKVLEGDNYWQNIEVEDSLLYRWEEDSTYLYPANFYQKEEFDKIDIKEAKILGLLEDNITIEQLCPSGQIPPYSCAAKYLQSKQLRVDEFNTYESRYANAEVMIRATLSNSNLKNSIVKPKEGGYTKDFQTNEIITIFDFSMKMKEQGTALVLFCGDNLGIGVLKQWAVKGLKLLGVKAIIAKSFKEEYRLALVEVGILPLEFIDEDINSLHLKGNEIITIEKDKLKMKDKIEIKIQKEKEIRVIELKLRLDTKIEIEYYKSGGTLSYFLKQ